MSFQIVSTTDIQRRFKDVLARLTSSKDPLMVVRDSEPAAVLVRYDEYQRLATLEQNFLKARMGEILDRLAKKNKTISDRQLDADIKLARHASRRR